MENKSKYPRVLYWNNDVKAGWARRRKKKILVEFLLKMHGNIQFTFNLKEARNLMEELERVIK